MANCKELRRLHREASSGDPWGDAMNTWFVVCSEIWFRGEKVPDKYGYNPGDPRDPEDYMTDPCAAATTQELLQFAEVLYRYTNWLERIGKSY